MAASRHSRTGTESLGLPLADGYFSAPDSPVGARKCKSAAASSSPDRGTAAQTNAKLKIDEGA
jgi:hypothetical protein